VIEPGDVSLAFRETIRRFESSADIRYGESGKESGVVEARLGNGSDLVQELLHLREDSQAAT
jgi:hypothetical protein